MHFDVIDVNSIEITAEYVLEQQIISSGGIGIGSGISSGGIGSGSGISFLFGILFSPLIP